MSIRFFGSSLLMAGTFVLAAIPAAHAQQPRTATHVDSLRAARNGKPVYFPAVFFFPSGKQAHGFLPGYTTCFIKQVECYDVSPERIPPPKLKVIAIDRLTSMTVDGHRYESLYLKGKPLGLLAENLAPPGPIELFGYAKTKNDMLIPIPFPTGGGMFVSTGTHEKYYWYVRAGPGATLLEVPRGGGDFAEFMAGFLAANPGVAARIRQRAKGARFEDLPDLIRAYNEQVPAK